MQLNKNKIIRPQNYPINNSAGMRSQSAIDMIYCAWRKP
jgi:hypothetical protein